MNLSATNELLDKSFGWNAIIVVSTLLFSLILACATPFAALAGLAALHLSRKQGLSVILAAWLLNQIIGYGLLDYPQTWDSFAWGAMIALAGLSAAGIAFAVDHRLAHSNELLRTLAVFASAFMTYEIVLSAATLLLPAGEEAFSFAVVMQILLINGLAFIGLSALQNLGLTLGLTLPRLSPVVATAH